MNCQKLLTGLLVAAGLAASARDSSAQTTIDACYVERTGVIYLIDPGATLPGDLPTACLKPDKHIQFSWVDGEGALHSALNGLTADDHLQYLPIDGSRGMTGKLTTTDKIGVGTTAPGAPMEILHSTIDHTQPHLLLNSANGSGQNTIELGHNGVLHSKIRGAGGGGLFIGTHFGGDLKFYTAAGEELDQAEETKMVIRPGGNVGIGTHTPSERLTVAGVVESTSGGFRFPDGTLQNTAASGGAPTGCSQGDVATWDEATDSWVCSAMPSLQHTIVHSNGTVPPYSEGGDIWAEIIFCAPGMVATGGGFSVEPGLVVDELMPDSDPTPNPRRNVMYIQMRNTTELAREFWVYAFCVVDF